jgi:hypothetical protein
MKKALLFVLVMVSLMLCGKSYRNQTVVSENIVRSLIDPEKYETIGTVIDSAFAPFDDPVFFEKTLKICKMSVGELDDSQVAEIQERGQELIDMMGSEYRFIGFKVIQHYSLRDDKTEIASEKKIYIMDKDMANIFVEYDPNSLDYIMVQAMYKMWMDETMRIRN